MEGDLRKENPKTTFHSEELGMTKKTLEVIISIVAFATEILAVIKDKLKNGRKDDDKGTAKEE